MWDAGKGGGKIGIAGKAQPSSSFAGVSKPPISGTSPPTPCFSRIPGRTREAGETRGPCRTNIRGFASENQQVKSVFQPLPPGRGRCIFAAIAHRFDAAGGHTGPPLRRTAHYAPTHAPPLLPSSPTRRGTPRSGVLTARPRRGERAGRRHRRGLESSVSRLCVLRFRTCPGLDPGSRGPYGPLVRNDGEGRYVVRGGT